MVCFILTVYLQLLAVVVAQIEAKINATRYEKGGKKLRKRWKIKAPNPITYHLMSDAHAHVHNIVYKHQFSNVVEPKIRNQSQSVVN